MPALRLARIVATFAKLTGGSRKARSLIVGPGCTCESCVQAWGRQQAPHKSVDRDPRRRLRLGLY